MHLCQVIHLCMRICHLWLHHFPVQLGGGGVSDKHKVSTSFLMCLAVVQANGI